MQVARNDFKYLRLMHFNWNSQTCLACQCIRFADYENYFAAIPIAGKLI